MRQRRGIPGQRGPPGRQQQRAPGHQVHRPSSRRSPATGPPQRQHRPRCGQRLPGTPPEMHQGTATLRPVNRAQPLKPSQMKRRSSETPRLPHRFPKGVPEWCHSSSPEACSPRPCSSPSQAACPSHRGPNQPGLPHLLRHPKPPSPLHPNRPSGQRQRPGQLSRRSPPRRRLPPRRRRRCPGRFPQPPR